MWWTGAAVTVLGSGSYLDWHRDMDNHLSIIELLCHKVEQQQLTYYYHLPNHNYGLT